MIDIAMKKEGKVTKLNNLPFAKAGLFYGYLQKHLKYQGDLSMRLEPRNESFVYTWDIKAGTKLWRAQKVLTAVEIESVVDLQQFAMFVTKTWKQQYLKARSDGTADRIITLTTKRFIAEYAKIQEQFLRDCGIDESNAHECELQSKASDPYRQELWHNGKHLGTITISTDSSDGLKYIVECVKTQRKEPITSPFKCPNCGGTHFGSTVHDNGSITYICHGEETYDTKTGTRKGKPPCGWKGSEAAFEEACNES